MMLALSTTIWKKIFASILLLKIAATAFGQSPDYTLHANIIYHFTKYIDWPAEKTQDEFTIGILGDSPLLDALRISVANKKAGNQKIMVKHYRPSAPNYDCQILFVSMEESDDIKKIIAKAGGSTLIVTESEGLAKKGACINFIIVAERLKLEINKDNIEKRGLGVASELLQLGKIIK